MKLIHWTFLLLLITTFSCRNTDDELFRMESEIRLDLVAGLNTFDTHGFIIENIPSTFEALAQQNGIPLESIGRVTPAVALMEGVFNEIDYSIIERMTIDLVAVDDETDRREIFFQELIPTNHSGPLQLFGSLPNLSEILLDERYNLVVEIKLRIPTTQYLENRIEYSFVAYADE